MRSKVGPAVGPPTSGHVRASPPKLPPHFIATRVKEGENEYYSVPSLIYPLSLYTLLLYILTSLYILTITF
jgi:hypothetical protein